eukprot:CAMPEP_0173170046 /NCGR_PEP_ID=MMETSP1141-20130122/1029_1 /TAXON_ID=483371 /ORGANISM="non described non described, Strain CCMP2298" /LENGTH=154 /DNA_ID=CAMNT_0014091915 /DNA_START=136 /DNA_END=597 /DNA_ORIENTATION=+
MSIKSASTPRAAPNPREALQKFYAMDASNPIPKSLADKIMPRRHAAENPGDFTKVRKERATSDLFDPRITLEQREQIASSILHGKVELLGEESSSRQRRPSVRPHDREKQRVASLTLQRHELPHNDFIALQSKRAYIPAMSGRGLLEAKRATMG